MNCLRTTCRTALRTTPRATPTSSASTWAPPTNRAANTRRKSLQHRNRRQVRGCSSVAPCWAWPCSAAKIQRAQHRPDTAAAQRVAVRKRHATGMEFNLAGAPARSGNCSSTTPGFLTPRSTAATWCSPANGGGAQVQGDRPGLTPSTAAASWSTYAITSKICAWALKCQPASKPRGPRPCTPAALRWVDDAMVEYAI